jgi:putative transcriptional regulator
LTNNQNGSIIFLQPNWLDNKKGSDKMVTNLKLARIKKGMKQKDLAQKVGITSQYLMNLEKGKSKNPSIMIMKKLSEELECSVEELFFSDEGAATPNDVKKDSESN